MAEINSKGISLKALVDKGNNRIIFAESNADFVDVLFSLLTMPMGTVIRLTRNQPPTGEIGCMNNLYQSVENLEVQCLHTEACKTILLHPRNDAETHCRSLKLIIDDGEPIKYFVCSSYNFSACKFLSHYRTALCRCGRLMSTEALLEVKESKNLIPDGGVFAKEQAQFIVSEKLDVLPLSTAACLSSFSKLGVMDGSTIVERTFNVGVDEVLNLLKCSLLSPAALTETLLKSKQFPQLGKESFDQGMSIQSQGEREASNSDRKICVKLILSKSKKILCYAEAGEDFVNLIFSFLTVPLGHVVKKMNGSSSKGCINHLFKSILDLDTEKSLKSDKHKELLINPKLASGFGYANQLLDIKEASNQPNFFMPEVYFVDSLFIKEKYSSGSASLTVMDPRFHYYKEAKSGGGFVKGPAVFTITDSLVVAPLSSISIISILDRLKVPFSDIEEKVVHVGNEEALRLLVASFVSESALTNAFNLRVPKQE
ncbi:hypothetical protein F0562_001035 [Nyssa sinensis]|uniref:DUF674 family protein n=1 Tax=Nyssa sinensis TaxID=561372 RepID=A0A5J5C6V1_9ASTE|nr:hypothetical protein F0562_001035 [Nyssa sinensis]